MSEQALPDFKLERLPKDLRDTFRALYSNRSTHTSYLSPNEVYQGDARELLQLIEPNSIALSVWSPPYFVGKEYEAYLSFEDWQYLLETVIYLHFPIIKPGGFFSCEYCRHFMFQRPRHAARAG